MHNDQYYNQKEGLAMRSPILPFTSVIYAYKNLKKTLYLVQPIQITLYAGLDF